MCIRDSLDRIANDVIRKKPGFRLHLPTTIRRSSWLARIKDWTARIAIKTLLLSKCLTFRIAEIATGQSGPQLSITNTNKWAIAGFATVLPHGMIIRIMTDGFLCAGITGAHAKLVIKTPPSIRLIPAGTAMISIIKEMGAVMIYYGNLRQEKINYAPYNFFSDFTHRDLSGAFNFSE
jgi:hypothetical protein